MPTRRKPMLLAAALTSCLLSGCSTSGVVTVDSSCRSFKPIAMSKNDTPDTKRQIIGHNRAYDAVCPDEFAKQRIAKWP